MKDEQNPNFIFSTTNTELLLKVVNRDVDIIEIAKKELADRGMGRHGQWIGFSDAKEYWKRVF